MKRSKMIFWTAFGVFAVCMTLMAAVLYAETPEMSGGGFISLSPWIDVAVWGAVMVVAGIVMLCCGLRKHLAIRVPHELRFPAAYGATQLILTASVLVMGLIGLFDRYGPVHLPIYGYAIVLCVAYVAAGFLWGRRYGGSVRTALLCFAVLLAVSALLTGTRLAEIEQEIAYWTKYFGPGNIGFGYTEPVMDSWQGQLLALLDLPACVLMGNYEFDYYQNLGMGHGIPREVMTWLVTLVPLPLFTGAWLLGRKTKR